MQKDWSPLRITLLLYLIVLILPVAFYYAHTSFEAIEKDTKIVQKTGWLDGSRPYLFSTSSQQDTQRTNHRVDRALQDISQWIEENKNSEFYLGGQTLSEDFSQASSCWNKHKEEVLQNVSVCESKMKELTLIIEKIVYSKQKKMINIFYLNLAAMMILVLFIIYLIRTYIRIQMKKHAIHDYETKLFNKKYLLAELKSSCARSVRYNHPLSILSISIDGFGEESGKYDAKAKTHILKMLGGSIISLTRTSDTASRYDENHFLILLPDTEEENALILEGRMREAIEKLDFGTDEDLNFNFSTTQFSTEETPQSCVAHAEKLLHNT